MLNIEYSFFHQKKTLIPYIKTIRCSENSKNRKSFLLHPDFCGVGNECSNWTRASGTIEAREINFWREHAAFQRSAFWRSTAGNDVVATFFISLFFFPPLFSFFSVATFSHRRSARITNLFSKSCLDRPKTWGERHLSSPRLPFRGPPAAILDFAGGAALQAVSERPLRR